MRKFIRKHLLMIVVVLYLILPWDLLPDYLGAIGFSDDTALIILALLKKYLEHRKKKNKK